MQEFIIRQLFPVVLSLSLSGALIGILIAAIHPLTGNYFSKKWNYYIWLLVVVRLLLPLHFESDFLTPLNFHAGFGQNDSAAHAASTVQNDSATQSGSIVQNDSATQSGSIVQNDSPAQADSIVPDAGEKQIGNSAQTGSMIPINAEKQIDSPEQSDGIQQSNQAEVNHSAAMTDASADSAANTSTDKALILPGANTTVTAQHSNDFSAKLSIAGIWAAAAHIWLIGAITALFIKLCSYQRFQSELKTNCTRITDNRVLTMEYAFCARLRIKKTPAIYASPSVSSPMTIGLWNPVILIPEVFSDQNAPAFLNAEQNLTHFQLMLHHELIHVARKDLLYKWIYQLLLCIHWFNPVLHLISRQISRDCELSCDEAILPKLTEIGKQMYGNILLDTAEQNIVHRQHAFSTTLLENKKDLKKRLDGILHYKKTTRFRLVLSACIFVLVLTLSACSTVWISSDAASSSEPKQDNSVNSSADSGSTASDASATDTNGKDTESFHYDDSDENGAFMQMFSSFVSADSFVDTSDSPDRSSDAWKVYDDDAMLAGEDIQDNWAAYNYMGGGNKLLAYGFVLYGSDTFLIVYADQDTDVTIKSAFDLREENFKIVSVAPDKSITTLNETGAETTATVTMKKGRNVLKMVGQGAKVMHLEIYYTDLDESKFENVFYSEGEEYIHLVKDGAVPVEKERIIENLNYLDEKDASDLFNTLLTVGTNFTADELCDFLIFSDAALSSQYLLEALRNQTIEPLSADTVPEIMPYLDGDCQTEVLKALPVEDFYDAFADSIYYLSDKQIEECLTDYIDRGGVLTFSMYDEISPYINEPIPQKLDKLIQN